MPFLILADDLTGAADCAARCHHAGLPSTIYLEPPSDPPPTGVISVTAESRELPADQAAGRVRDVMTKIGRTGDRIWYKKIDSTLRGHIGVELDAMLSERETQRTAPVVVVCPAFPAQQRGLRDGFLECEACPPRSMHLPDLLARQTDRPIAALHLADVRSGVAELADRLNALQNRGDQLLIVDAMSDDDLRTLVAATAKAVPDALFCGSAGLIGILAETRNAHRSQVSEARAMPRNRPVLTVIGSASTMAHRQIESVRQRANVHVTNVAEPDAEQRIDAIDQQATEACVLHLPSATVGNALDPAQLNGLARAAMRFVRRVDCARLILTGGATARAVLDRLGIAALHVVDECLPGMPLTQTVDADERQRFIVLKAGNHGTANTLVELLNRLRSER